MPSKSTHRPRRLLLRCRLCLAWLCTSSQECRCSLIKRHHELGSQRRETVGVQSAGGAKGLRARQFKYERNKLSAPLVYGLSDKAGPAATREGISSESI